jgi:small conductance mechanosensitive channel
MPRESTVFLSLKAPLLFAALLILMFTIFVSVASGQEAVSSEQLSESILRVEGSIAKLRQLAEQTGNKSGTDREELEFRLDQRTIRLMDGVAKLTRNVASLPAEDPDRLVLEKRLRADLAGIDRLLFQRIEDLDKRITANREATGSVGDAEKYMQQGYGHSLEGLLLGYYAVLVGVVESQQLLGVSDQELRDNTEALLYQYTEQVSGRIELLGTTSRGVRARLALDSTNTGLQSAAKEINMQRTLAISRLESLLGLMSRLDVDTVHYRSVLLREKKGVSLGLFDIQALKGMLQDGWENTRESLGKNLPDLLFKLVVFLLILLIFRALSHLVKRLAGKALKSSSVNMSTLLKDILVSASGAAVMLLGILVALAQVGISLGPALAGLGLAGFILGFALQDTLGNFAAGAMILIYRPYDVDDFVEVTGAAGLVKKMTLVSTTIITFDNQTLIIPNSKIWGDVIKNVTAQRTRRVDLEFAISYGDDIDKAERVLREIVTAHAKVLEEPEPNVRLHKLDDSSVNFVVRPWTKTADYWEVYWDITREVKVRFDLEDITIPFPQRDVHVQGSTEPG